MQALLLAFIFDQPNKFYLQKNMIMRLLFLLFSLTGVQFLIAQPIPKVILVIADGIPADVMERLQPPAMQQIIKQGAYKRAYVGGIAGTYKETPTISAPGYNDMLTGTWGYKHNVWDNDNQKPNYNYPSVFRLFKTVKPGGKTAIFSTWIDNREVLLGAGLPQTNNLKIDYICDGYEKDTLSFPHDKSGLYMHKIDEYVIHCADSVVRNYAPDLSWIYLENTDEVGHRKGTGAPFDSAIFMLDNQIKKIAEAIQYRETNYNEKWLLIITTDHGRDSIKGHNHGGQTQRERTTWIIINKANTNAYFADNSPAIVDILPSVANYLNFSLPETAAKEIDGVPFIGNISVSNARIESGGDSLTVYWDSFVPDEQLAVSISYTNNTKNGGTDTYQLLGKAKSSDKQFRCTVKDLSKQNFYKVLIEGKYNDANVWHTASK